MDSGDGWEIEGKLCDFLPHSVDTLNGRVFIDEVLNFIGKLQGLADFLFGFRQSIVGSKYSD